MLVYKFFEFHLPYLTMNFHNLPHTNDKSSKKWWICWVKSFKKHEWRSIQWELISKNVLWVLNILSLFVRHYEAVNNMGTFDTFISWNFRTFLGMQFFLESMFWLNTIQVPEKSLNLGLILPISKIFKFNQTMACGYSIPVPGDA